MMRALPLVALWLCASLATVLLTNGAAAAPIHPARGGLAQIVAAQEITATVDLTSAAALPANDLTRVPEAVSTGGPVNPVPTLGAGGVANPVGNDAAPAPILGTTAAVDTGTPWPLIIGGLLIVALAAAGLYFYSRRGPGAARVVTTPIDPNAPGKERVVRADAPTTPLTAASGDIRCPNCGTMNPANQRFCDECGQDLRVIAAAAAPVAAPAAPPVVADPTDESQMPYLETLSRPAEQLEYVLTREAITIGRAADNDIVIDEQFIGWPTVSQNHARLRREGNDFLLEDLNSENGTFINGARTGQNVLEDGMTISIGKVDFIYRVP